MGIIGWSTPHTPHALITRWEVSSVLDNELLILV